MAVNDWARESFLREVANTRNLDHPNVVRLYDSGSHKGVFFYTMEYCDGGSLEDLRLKRGGRLKAAEALPLILGALDGLEYIHQAPIGQVKLADGGIGEGRGLVHRDLKPANIFLHGSGEKAVAKIADVGVGKAFDMAGLSGQTRTGTVAGSPVVSPRQQVINFKYATPDVDVWAMAASLYILLAGTYPRDFDNNRDPWLVVLETNPAPIRQRNPNIPSGLADVIDRALIDNPQILFKTAAVLKQALLAAI
jgi:serine/threonine protein kinase